jgi:hypothetical protein
VKVRKGWKCGVPLWLPTNHVTFMELPTYFLTDDLQLHLDWTCVRYCRRKLYYPFSKSFLVSGAWIDRYIEVDGRCLFGKPISFQLVPFGVGL